MSGRTLVIRLNKTLHLGIETKFAMTLRILNKWLYHTRAAFSLTGRIYTSYYRLTRYRQVQKQTSYPSIHLQAPFCPLSPLSPVLTLFLILSFLPSQSLPPLLTRIPYSRLGSNPSLASRPLFPRSSSAHCIKFRVISLFISTHVHASSA